MPKDWCRNLLDQWHATGEVITHSFIKHGGNMVAACMVAPNNVRKDTAAMYFLCKGSGLFTTTAIKSRSWLYSKGMQNTNRRSDQ